MFSRPYNSPNRMYISKKNTVGDTPVPPAPATILYMTEINV